MGSRSHAGIRGSPFVALGYSAPPALSPGEEFFYRRDTEHSEHYRRRLIHQLERLGHKVTLEPLPDAA